MRRSERGVDTRRLRKIVRQYGRPGIFYVGFYLLMRRTSARIAVAALSVLGALTIWAATRPAVIPATVAPAPWPSGAQHGNGEEPYEPQISLMSRARKLADIDPNTDGWAWIDAHELLVAVHSDGGSYTSDESDHMWRGIAERLDVETGTCRRLRGLTALLERQNGTPTHFEVSPGRHWVKFELMGQAMSLPEPLDSRQAVDYDPSDGMDIGTGVVAPLNPGTDDKREIHGVFDGFWASERYWIEDYTDMPIGRQRLVRLLDPATGKRTALPVTSAKAVWLVKYLNTDARVFRVERMGDLLPDAITLPTEHTDPTPETNTNYGQDVDKTRTFDAAGGEAVATKRMETMRLQEFLHTDPNNPVRSHDISLPSNCRVLQVTEMKGNRLIYALWIDSGRHANAMDMWVSRRDGSDLHELGYLDFYVDSSSDQDWVFRWNPRDHGLSFVAANALWSVDTRQ